MLSVHTVYYALYWVVNQPNVLPKDMLDNNWWTNVKKNCMERLYCKQMNRSPQAVSLHISLPCISSPSLLSLSLSLSLSLYMFMYRQFHITCVPTAVWVSACVCLCLCGSLCHFLMSTSLWTTSKQLRLHKSRDR